MSQAAFTHSLAGRISNADVEAAFSNAQCHVPSIRRLRRARLLWAFRRERFRIAQAVLFVANVLLFACRQLRGAVDRSGAWKEGLFVCGVGVATGLSIVTIVFITNDTSVSVSSGCLGAIVGAGALYGLLYARASTFDSRDTMKIRQAQKASEFRRSEVVRELANVRRLYASAFGRYLELKRIVESRIHRLLTCDWRSLRGIPFESFLAQVFLELGFEVELTKASGDQGADLIAKGSGRRIAIQAKGWQDAVGNHAVQEVHAGMAYYGCGRCMVITNSTFTHAAVDLAGKIGCVLIDGSQIEALIRGQIAV